MNWSSLTFHPDVSCFIYRILKNFLSDLMTSRSFSTALKTTSDKWNLIQTRGWNGLLTDCCDLFFCVGLTCSSLLRQKMNSSARVGFRIDGDPGLSSEGRSMFLCNHITLPCYLSFSLCRNTTDSQPAKLTLAKPYSDLNHRVTISTAPKRTQDGRRCEDTILLRYSIRCKTISLMFISWCEPNRTSQIVDLFTEQNMFETLSENKVHSLNFLHSVVNWQKNQRTQSTLKCVCGGK